MNSTLRIFAVALLYHAGNSHQISLSEMSLPGVEVLIEKLLPKILGRLGKENPSKKNDAKWLLYSARAL